MAEYPHAGHRQRLRDKFLTGGPEALSEAELLELLLFYSIPRVDTRPMAEALIQAFGSLDGVLAAQPEELHAFAKLTSGTDALFSLLGYLRESAVQALREARFDSPAYLNGYLPKQFSGFRKERVLLFYLRADCSVLRRQTVMSSAEGSVRMTVNSYAETALRLGANSILVAHNHPNGRAAPSGADLDATARLVTSLQRKGLSLLEHYIVAGTECYPILANHEYLRAGVETVTDDDANGIQLN